MEKRGLGWQRREVPGPQAGGGPTAAEESSPRGPETTFFDGSCQLEGSLQLASSIEISGEFRGAVESCETVTVGEEGCVEADIRARTVIVRGAVVGDVTGTREVVLAATARLHGAVETPSLVIERGAFFSGTTRMYRPERAVRERAAAEAPPPPAPAARADG